MSHVALLRFRRATDSPVTASWCDCGRSRYGGVIEADYKPDRLIQMPLQSGKGEEKGEEKSRGELEEETLPEFFILLVSFAVSFLLACGLLFISIKTW